MKMTRSERLAKTGRVDVSYLGGFETARVLKTCNELDGLRYVATDFECLYDGKDAIADIYEDEEGNVFAVIDKR